jgi:hypothetical protein
MNPDQDRRDPDRNRRSTDVRLIDLEEANDKQRKANVLQQIANVKQKRENRVFYVLVLIAAALIAYSYNHDARTHSKQNHTEIARVQTVASALANVTSQISKNQQATCKVQARSLTAGVYLRTGLLDVSKFLAVVIPAELPLNATQSKYLDGIESRFTHYYNIEKHQPTHKTCASADKKTKTTKAKTKP